MKERFEINGVAVDAEYADQDVQEVFLPLLEELARRHRQTAGRMIALLAAPPAAGKSTLAALLERLASRVPGMPPVQALGMDGFHYHADYIAAHTVLRDGRCVPMSRVKGAPESFDVEKLRCALNALRREDGLFPRYDRGLHDVVEDAIAVRAPILLIEGNWLLLDQPAWRALPRDYAVFLEAPEPLLRARMIDRSLRTGRGPEEAERLWAECDGPNADLCLRCHTAPDALLRLDACGRFTRLA